MPLPSRQRLWASISIRPIAQVAALQILAFVLVFSKTEPGTFGRLALVLGFAVGVAALPLGRILSTLLANQPRVYCWSGRVWVASVHAVFAMTIGGAYDGTGVALAERMCTPFGLAAAVGLGFGAGAQGALLNVPRDIAANMGVTLLAMVAIKLHAAYTHAYLALNVVAVGSLAFGYVVVSECADVQEAVREAAEAVVLGAAAREPFVVTDVQMNILAVNQRLINVLGYAEHELVGKPVMDLVTHGEELANDHAWVRRTLFEAASRKQNPNGHVWSARVKNGTEHPVRITLGEARCPTNGTKMFTALFTCMRLEQRNTQLCAEKEKLQWEVASHHDDDWEDPRERLGATVVSVKLEGAPSGCGDNCQMFDKPYRTLGAMQDQATTDEAISIANSFDHVNSNASPTLPGRPLVAPPSPPSALSVGSVSVISLKSSVMDTASVAAAKDITRAPPPAKSSRPPRPKKVCSEPSSKPMADSMPRAARSGSLPAVERVGPDPREDC